MIIEEKTLEYVDEPESQAIKVGVRANSKNQFVRHGLFLLENGEQSWVPVSRDGTYRVFNIKK